jgi:anti-sigma-K factor RskA
VTEIQPSRSCGDDVAAYALGALEPAEAESFRRHLKQCAVCRDELSSFQQVVNALPMSATQYPAPDSLRLRVLAITETEPAHPSQRPHREPRRRRGFTLPRPAMALAAVVVVAAVAIAAVALSSVGGTSTRVYRAQVAGVTGTAQLRVTGGHGVLIVRHLSPPPAGKIYEVWVARPNRPPQPTTALFSVNTQGAGDVGVPGSLKGVNQVMVTPEPAGGSREPTHAPVISAKLT